MLRPASLRDHDAPSKSRRRRIDWPRALRAIRTLRDDPERTDQVFELNAALDGGDLERQFQAFLGEPGAADLLAEGRDLLACLADRDALRALDPESLGATYLRVMEAAGYEADGLEQAADQVDAFAELHPGRARTWFASRQTAAHDLLHVLTGYGQDVAGEAALMAFSDGIAPRGARLKVNRFGLVSSLVESPRASRRMAARFCFQARRRGRRADIPLSFRWEDALAERLPSLRAKLGVAAAEEAHPAGQLRGNNDAPWRLEPYATAS